MLRTRGAFVVARSQIAVDVALSLGVVSLVVDRARLRFDTRFVGATQPVIRDGLTVKLVLEGRLQWGDGPGREGPIAFALPASESDGVADGSLRYWIEGERVRLLEFWLEGHPGLRRGPELPSAALLQAAEALFGAAAPAGDAPCDDEVRIGSTNALLAALAGEGWCQPRTLLDISGPAWERLRAAFKQVDLQRSLKVLAGGSAVSERQFHRDFGALADVAGTGFRETLRRWRLRLGVILLSAPEGSVAEVARTLGYARPEAMNAVFRSAGLPRPSELRAALLRAAESPSALEKR
jgi:AraC-like DNA-binding protein